MARQTVNLIAELCRVLDSSDGMMRLAIYHKQVTVDGYIIKITDESRWTREQLRGRMAKIPGRSCRLFYGSQRATGVAA